MAVEAGCEVLISIDDDNVITGEEDFVVKHHLVGTKAAGNVVRTSDGWFNICSLLETDVPGEVYPWVFPYSALRPREVETQPGETELTIARQRRSERAARNGGSKCSPAVFPNKSR